MSSSWVCPYPLPYCDVNGKSSGALEFDDIVRLLLISSLASLPSWSSRSADDFLFFLWFANSHLFCSRMHRAQGGFRGASTEPRSHFYLPLSAAFAGLVIATVLRLRQVVITWLRRLRMLLIGLAGNALLRTWRIGLRHGNDRSAGGWQMNSREKRLHSVERGETASRAD